MVPTPTILATDQSDFWVRYVGGMVKNGSGFTGFRQVDFWKIKFFCETSMEVGVFEREENKM